MKVSWRFLLRLTAIALPAAHRKPRFDLAAWCFDQAWEHPGDIFQTASKSKPARHCQSRAPRACQPLVHELNSHTQAPPSRLHARCRELGSSRVDRLRLSPGPGGELSGREGEFLEAFQATKGRGYRRVIFRANAASAVQTRNLAHRAGGSTLQELRR